MRTSQESKTKGVRRHARAHVELYLGDSRLTLQSTHPFARSAVTRPKMSVLRCIYVIKITFRPQGRHTPAAAVNVTPRVPACKYTYGTTMISRFVFSVHHVVLKPIGRTRYPVWVRRCAGAGTGIKYVPDHFPNGKPNDPSAEHRVVLTGVWASFTPDEQCTYRKSRVHRRYVLKNRLFFIYLYYNIQRVSCV
jgi:hypothetical protein